MKFVKGISLFFIYPLIMFCLGMYTGIIFQDYFYPGKDLYGRQEMVLDIPQSEVEVQNSPETNVPVEKSIPIVETILKEEVLNTDTEYVLEEMDVKKGTSVETEWKIPVKYIGMNRERFLEAMDEYELSPPLQELERGFVGLEVISFSSQRVMIRMDYSYVEPSSAFYLGAKNNYVVVYLDDKETIYIETDILLTDLPDAMQQQIILFLYMESEEALYNFLESYSS